jgi:hypothetical protein
MRPFRVGSGEAKGMTANVSIAGMKASAGAITNNGLYAASGYVSSFMKFYSPSAAG